MPGEEMTYSGPRAVQSYERITCAEYGCAGCTWVHRRMVGEPRYYLGEERITRALYDQLCKEYEGVTNG